MGIRCGQFTSTCGAAIMNFYDAGDEDNFYTRLMGFEQSCMEEADPMFFLNAIRDADCPEDMASGGGSPPSPSPPPPPPAASGKPAPYLSNKYLSRAAAAAATVLFFLSRVSDPLIYC